MREFLGCLFVAFIAYSFEWNWVAAIFVLAAIGNLIPDKKSKKHKGRAKTKKDKKNSLSDDNSHPDEMLRSNGDTFGLHERWQNHYHRVDDHVDKGQLKKAILELRKAYATGARGLSTIAMYTQLPELLFQAGNKNEAYNELAKLSTYGRPFHPVDVGSQDWHRDQYEIIETKRTFLKEEQIWDQYVYDGCASYFHILQLGHEDFRTSRRLMKNRILGKAFEEMGLKHHQKEAVNKIQTWVNNSPSEPEILADQLNEYWKNMSKEEIRKSK